MPHRFTESTYFSPILKADLNNLKFPRDSILLHYMNDLLLCSLSQTSSQESRIHLLKLLALTGCKITKEKKLTVCPNPGSILRASDMRTRVTSTSR